MQKYRHLVSVLKISNLQKSYFFVQFLFRFFTISGVKPAA